jgi:hypothetical protein
MLILQVLTICFLVVLMLCSFFWFLCYAPSSGPYAIILLLNLMSCSFFWSLCSAHSSGPYAIILLLVLMHCSFFWSLCLKVLGTFILNDPCNSNIPPTQLVGTLRLDVHIGSTRCCRFLWRLMMVMSPLEHSEHTYSMLGKYIASAVHTFLYVCV